MSGCGALPKSTRDTATTGGHVVDPASRKEHGVAKAWQARGGRISDHVDRGGRLTPSHALSHARQVRALVVHVSFVTLSPPERAPDHEAVLPRLLAEFFPMRRYMCHIATFLLLRRGSVLVPAFSETPRAEH